MGERNQNTGHSGVLLLLSSNSFLDLGSHGWQINQDQKTGPRSRVGISGKYRNLRMTAPHWAASGFLFAKIRV